MELQGKIIMDLPLQEGVSKAGNPWKKKEWVIETFGQYPRKVKFHIFGEDRINANNFEVGKDYTISFDLESREFNGRWYTDVAVYASRPMEANQGFGAAPQPEFGAAPQQSFGGMQQGFGAQQGFGQQTGEPAPAFGASNQSDDLPF